MKNKSKPLEGAPLLLSRCARHASLANNTDVLPESKEKEDGEKKKEKKGKIPITATTIRR